MAASTNAVVIVPAGVVSIASGATISFSISWGANISPTRWSRVWPALISPGDADSAQSVTIVSEASTWSLSSPATSVNQTTLRGQGRSGAAVVARLQLLCSQVDTF
jgi:hypothetical protein